MSPDMNLWHRIIGSARTRLGRQQAALDLEEEFRNHIELEVEHQHRNGVSLEDAKRAALKTFGNKTVIREDVQDVWTWPVLGQTVRDVRIGARVLLKSPLFTTFAVLILSVGIGANVALFTYINALFLKPLDVPNAGSLVRIYGNGEGPNGVISYSSYMKYRDANQAFSEVGLYCCTGTAIPLRAEGPMALPIDVIRPALVSGSLFHIIGNAPVVGRNIQPDDERTGSPDVVMLNETAWREYFSLDRSVIGRTLFLNNTPHTVIGIVSKSAESALDVLPTPTAPKIYIPIRQVVDGRVGSMLGRLRDGISRSQAQADLSRIADQLSAEYKFQISVTVEPSNRPPSWVWVALATLISFCILGVCIVLLIACDDIAILLVARIEARQREMGVRLALGAGRVQLIRQLVAENLLLALLGGTGAMVFALLASRGIERFPLQLIPLPDSSRLTFDWRVLLFTIAISLLTTLFFGLRPALQCVRRDVTASLSPGPRSPGSTAPNSRANLVMTHVTVCTALMITAAVMVRSAQLQMSVDRGFDSSHILIGSINFSGTGYDRERALAFYTRLLLRMKESPGIVSATFVDSLPVAMPGAFRFGGALSRYVVRSDTSNKAISVASNAVSPGHFDTLRVRLLQGRDFTARDDSRSPNVVVVNQALASQLWQHETPIGRILRGDDGAIIEVIGVASDIHYQSDEQRASPLLYRPLSQRPGFPPTTFMVKTTAEPTLAAVTIQRLVAEIDPHLLVYHTRTLEDQISKTLLPYRIFAYVAGIPGVFALLLGLIGTYGTMALIVEQQRRDIGVRIALGAHPSSAVFLMVRQGMKWTMGGLALGTTTAVLISIWLNRNFHDMNFF